MDLHQAEAFLDHTADCSEKKPAIVIHDRDSKFTVEFVQTLKLRGVRNKILPKASPNLNGRVERATLTLRSEWLSRFILFGKRHLDYIVTSFTECYNLRRTHSSRDSLPPIREFPEEVASLEMAQVEVRSYVGNDKNTNRRKKKKANPTFPTCRRPPSTTAICKSPGSIATLAKVRIPSTGGAEFLRRKRDAQGQRVHVRLHSAGRW